MPRRQSCRRYGKFAPRLQWSGWSCARALLADDRASLFSCAGAFCNRRVDAALSMGTKQREHRESWRCWPASCPARRRLAPVRVHAWGGWWDLDYPLTLKRRRLVIVFIPYAVFCEEFRQSADGSVTIDRVIDKVVCVEKGASVRGHKSKLPILKVRYAACFKSAAPVVGLKVDLRCTRPSGDEFLAGTKMLDLPGDYRGTFLSGELELVPQENGWHTFHVVVNGIEKTRMVLHLSVERAEENDRLIGRSFPIRSVTHASWGTAAAIFLGNTSSARIS